MRGIPMLCMALLATLTAGAQQFSRADTLRGSITPQRAWWDVTSYDLHVQVNPDDSTFSGFNTITYQVLKTDSVMQIDLQVPMVIDSVVQDKKSLTVTRDGNAWFIKMVSPHAKDKSKKITVYYSGKPRKALKAPWDGGVVWAKDEKGRPWIATACQGLGASIWWPNKDTQSDEPEDMTISVTVPADLTDVSNGRLKKTIDNPDGTKTFVWYVGSPINNYDVAVNVGNYIEMKDTWHGEGGKLDLGFWVLDYNEDKAREHFKVVKPMLKCFEYWFGKYPFYKDSYKLIEAPFLGMEHQSGVAYGNKYLMGYSGRDLSGTGWGLKWDFLIIHESGHEWFGNSITSKDLADMWIHESFTNYSETLFTECQYGHKAAEEYVQGIRKNILNDVPIIPPYGVNAEGSGDMYYKGANMLHNIRQIMEDDEAFRQLLRGLNKTFYHQTVTTQEVEQYMSQVVGMNLSKVFDQYLRHTTIPTLEYRFNGQQIQYRWVSDVKDFNMPVKVKLSDNGFKLIYPGTLWRSSNITLSNLKNFEVDKNFYINSKQVK
ncbi:M1 family metallopeptidase [Chitinophaga ginsengisegetis]|uniref:M1 family metallopeptidase n=1 Tax=Chitinophaga ginsengisegetis TaxID=393003 RepID=UPI000DBA0CA4|nr:M1 family metallopeptidase [Chitinophaga ginsengisegetis]MDR6567743.1 aminopeptidase N [Chitinophaga ginsengisegetis]MDR6647702.1 aminopeptidase N [Chitinophaga ginsengisegetis]MDR6654052.1 aminopeptidase N [Chitinophaga ginsengisegetis]